VESIATVKLNVSSRQVHFCVSLYIRLLPCLTSETTHPTPATTEAPWGGGNKVKVVPVLDQLSTTPWRRMGEWMYRSAFSWRRH
jgi:hypothetical protein